MRGRLENPFPDRDYLDRSLLDLDGSFLVSGDNHHTFKMYERIRLLFVLYWKQYGGFTY